MAKDTRIAFNALVKKLQPSIRRAFLNAMADISDSAVLEEIDIAIATGNVEAIMTALNMTPDFLGPLDRAITDVYVAGGDAQLNIVPKRPPPSARRNGATRINIRFNGRHPRAEAAIADQVTKVVGVTLESARETIREVLLTRAIEGRTRSETVLDLAGRMNKSGHRVGGLVGIGDKRALAVKRARDELTGDINGRYFDRKLRDRRFDSKIKKAQADGKTLNKKDIDKIIGRYSDRHLKDRGEVIARTETHASLNQGKAEGIKQLIDTGKVTQEMVTKFWDATPSGRTRDTHSKLDEQERPEDEAFDSPSGAKLMYPHDPSAPAEETINCRCSARYKIDYLQQAR